MTRICTNSVVDRHRFDADSDLSFLVDDDPGPNPDCHQNDADPHADPTPSFTHDVGKSEFGFILVMCSFASLQCCNILISLKNVIILSILDSILKVCGKMIHKLFHMLGSDTDPDPAK
jgi:hypothetical protein